jgi:hypothetical protein
MRVPSALAIILAENRVVRQRCALCRERAAIQGRSSADRRGGIRVAVLPRMEARTHRFARVLPVLVLLAIGVAGLYFGYRAPEVTVAVVLLALAGVWLIAERLTGRWWY